MSVKCLDVSYSEFNLNSIKSDEAIFVAPEVAPTITHINQRMRCPNLLERLNKGQKQNTIKHFMVLYSCVARKQYFAGRPCVEVVVARGVIYVFQFWSH